MDYATFKDTLGHGAPPAGLSRLLQALWHDANGDWGEAHRLAQAQDDREGAWVHAYLHRKEGDRSNAAYWYRRPGGLCPGCRWRKSGKRLPRHCWRSATVSEAV